MKNKLNKSFKEFLIFVALAVGAGLVKLLSGIPTEFFYRLSFGIFIALCIWLLIKFKYKPERYLNQWGYFVLTANNELEHRHIAKKILARDLRQNEVVHHINGKKTDALVPIADMLNHKIPKMTSWYFSDEKRGFVVQNSDE